MGHVVPEDKRPHWIPQQGDYSPQHAESREGDYKAAEENLEEGDHEASGQRERDMLLHRSVEKRERGIPGA